MNYKPAQLWLQEFKNMKGYEDMSDRELLKATNRLIAGNPDFKERIAEAAKIYAKDVKIALDIARAFGESEEKVIADSLLLFHENHFNIK